LNISEFQQSRINIEGVCIAEIYEHIEYLYW
jgi:hypothetical protein